MHKCKWCSNKSNNTKENRPGVKLYAIPKNENIRRKWLKIFGTDSCNDWEPMCSDHFQNYMPEKKQILFSKAIPQSYDRNGFPSNYAIQSNDVETGSNIILPMEQNITREEHIGNAGVNSFKSPRRSSRLTRNRARNNEDMRSGQMPDHTLGSGLQCSVKNCMNRLSKNLSLFGYPKDITLRKLWIRKCGIKTDATKKVMSSTRVCSIHFEPGCFKNSKLKNRLKPGAVPSLFLDNENSGVKTDDDNTVMISSKVNNSHFELYIFKNTELKNKLKEGHVPYLVFDNEKCGVTTDAAKIETSRTRVCRTHLDLNCFKKYILKKTFQTSAVPLFLNNDNTDNTSMTIDLTIDDSSNSSLSITSEPIEERTSQCIMDVCKTNNKSWSENKNNGNDNTDNTSMIIDLTIDDSSNSSLSITLEPIEERTSQCIMDVCKTNNNTRNEQGLIYKISRATGNISTPSTIIGTVQTDNNVSEEDSFVQINDSLDNINTTTPEHISTPEPTSSSEPKNKKPKITTFQQSLLEVMKNPPMIKSNNDEFDPDKAFLLSFLPDFKKMNDSQKLDFKILFMQSVRHILNPSSDYPQYSNIQQFNYPNNFYSPNSHTPSLNQFPVQSFHPSVTQTVHTPSSHSQPPPSSFSPTDYEDIGMHHSV